MNESIRYFNFPIKLLDGFLVNTKDVLTDILYYSLYAHSTKYVFDEEEPLKRMKAAVKFYGVRIGNLERATEVGMELFEHYSDSSVPFCGINTSIFWNYHDNPKTDFQKACLLAFLAIKSILGTKPYCKMTNDYLLARMDGWQKACPVEALSPEVAKFSNEYQLNKIKKTLQVDWYLIYYSSRMRGFYVSFDMKREDLIFEAEKKRLNVKIRKLEAEQKKAKEIAMQRIRDHYGD